MGALKLLEINETDLIFRDLEMPVINGFETTPCIKDKYTFSQKQLPVVAITTHDPDIFLMNLKNIGFDEKITLNSLDKIKSTIELFCIK